MGVYAWSFTTNAGEEKYEEVNVEGDILTHITVRFPPGPAGLLKVAIYYGIYKVFPEEASEYFQGDGEIIDFDTYWELPEQKTTLKIYLKNESTSYAHTVYIRLKTEWRKNTLAERMVSALMDAFRMLFRVF